MCEHIVHWLLGCVVVPAANRFLGQMFDLQANESQKEKTQTSSPSDVYSIHYNVNLTRRKKIDQRFFRFTFSAFVSNEQQNTPAGRLNQRRGEFIATIDVFARCCCCCCFLHGSRIISKFFPSFCHRTTKWVNEVVGRLNLSAKLFNTFAPHLSVNRIWHSHILHHRLNTIIIISTNSSSSNHLYHHPKCVWVWPDAHRRSI